MVLLKSYCSFFETTVGSTNSKWFVGVQEEKSDNNNKPTKKPHCDKWSEILTLSLII